MRGSLATLVGFPVCVSGNEGLERKIERERERDRDSARVRDNETERDNERERDMGVSTLSWHYLIYSEEMNISQ